MHVNLPICFGNPSPLGTAFRQVKMHKSLSFIITEFVCKVKCSAIKQIPFYYTCNKKPPCTTAQRLSISGKLGLLSAQHKVPSRILACTLQGNVVKDIVHVGGIYRAITVNIGSGDLVSGEIAGHACTAVCHAEHGFEYIVGVEHAVTGSVALCNCRSGRGSGCSRCGCCCGGVCGIGRGVGRLFGGGFCRGSCRCCGGSGGFGCGFCGGYGLVGNGVVGVPVVVDSGVQNRTIIAMNGLSFSNLLPKPV